DRGRAWFTDPATDARPGELGHESVFRADPQPDGRWSIARASLDTTRPRTALMSADGTHLYVADSPDAPGNYFGGIARSMPRQLYRYPVKADGSLDDFYVLHDFGPGRGIDGMCLNSSGQIVAAAGHNKSGPGPIIYVFAPNGRIMSTHPTPVDTPTDCAFGGAGLDALYVTFAGGEVYRVPNPGLKGRRAGG
ncbi:MAG: SMP-30/gluconolactonase/LRE family protein, partial [Armatimonadetes bacterium]|nr:SMP-30/gluconolactonase/LRE family protein [Armatimonadota bacterium]